jgi:predicted dehydrogenase
VEKEKSSQKGPLRVAVVGAGHLGNYHLQKYRNLPQCELRFAVDVMAERANRAALAYGCRAAYDHLELAGQVDAVSICVPTVDHCRVAGDLLKAGIHVLVEKPICATLAEADEIIALARQRGLCLQVGMIERFNPAVQALDSLQIEPLFIEAHRLHPFQERGSEIDVVFDLMIHDLDIINKFVKSPVRRMDAAGISVLSEKTDIVNARISFANGCIANVTTSRLSLKKMQKIRFFERGGYHSIDYQQRELVSLALKVNGEGKREIVPNLLDVAKQDPLEEEIRSFVTAVSAGRAPQVTGEEGREALALAYLVLENMKTVSES